MKGMLRYGPFTPSRLLAIYGPLASVGDRLFYMLSDINPQYIYRGTKIRRIQT